MKKPPHGYTWSGRLLTHIHATTRPDHLWPEVWSGKSKTAQRREKQQWAIEKPKLDDARKLRDIFVIDPKDVEFKATMKNARKKLDLPMEAAMPCKVQNHQRRETCGESDTRSSKCAASWKLTILRQSVSKESNLRS